MIFVSGTNVTNRSFCITRSRVDESKSRITYTVRSFFLLPLPNDDTSIYNCCCFASPPSPIFERDRCIPILVSVRFIRKEAIVGPGYQESCLHSFTLCFEDLAERMHVIVLLQPRLKLTVTSCTSCVITVKIILKSRKKFTRYLM